MMSTRTYTETDLPELHLAGLTGSVTETSQVGPEIGPMFEAVDAAVTAAGAQRSGPSVGYYTDQGDSVLIGAADQLADGVVPEGLEATTLAPVPRALTTTYAEPDLTGLPHAWQELVAEAERRGLPIAGPCREIYVGAPFTGAGGWVVELQQPVG